MNAASRARLLVRGLIVAAALAVAIPAHGQPVPAPVDVLGYQVGDHFTDVAGIERYMEALAEASDRVVLRPYGESWERRPLLQVVFGTPAHLADLDAILARNRELTDPDTSPERASEIAASNPAVVYFTYGVHGNESSSPEAAIWTAYDLAVDDPGVAGVLDSVVVVMDPSANPDGRDRYVNFYRSAAQLRRNTNTEIRERREPWPGGRSNHYLFDLNRDWAWLTQIESRQRVERWQEWNPQVHVDFHEMGYTSSYFFFPAATPINTIFPDHILEWGERFGAGNARAMDDEGLLYYTGQNFDLFYPGYGDSWPSLVGAIGMTYEQGGGGFGGRQVERPDGTVLTLRDRAFGHRTTGHATLRTTMQGKTELLEGYAAFHREIDEGLDDVYLVPGDDPDRVGELVALLLRHGVQVERLGSETSMALAPYPGFDSREAFPAGTYRVRARQPRGRLAGALLRPDNPLEGSSSYDITAWALPWAYGVEAHHGSDVDAGEWSSVGSMEPRDGDPVPGTGSYGYLMPPSFASAPGLVSFLEEGGRVFAMADTFSIEGTDYPRGTWFFPKGRNEDLEQRLQTAGLGARVTPIATGYSTSGPDLGSNDRATIEMPRIALMGGEGTSSTSFGAHWHFMERELDLPFDAVDLADAGSMDLETWDVIVLPGGNPQGALGTGGMERLEEWVRSGGTLVAVGSAATRIGSAFADVEVRRSLDEDEDEPDRDERLAEALRTREQREADSWEDRIPGTILPVTMDPAHPLTFGAGVDGPARTFVLSTGTGFEPSTSHETVGHFPEGLDRISGVISDSNLERLDRSGWLVESRVGGGRVVLFADDPLFRGFWYSARPLYTNALLLAPNF